MNTRFSYIETSDLALVSALLALGIPLSEETPFIKVTTTYGKNYKFFLQESSACGTYNTQHIINAWHDKDFANSNPEHPLAYIKCAYQNKEALLDVVKQSHDLVVMERNGKLIIISENASKELQEKIFREI
jgi:hypothetical protein